METYNTTQRQRLENAQKRVKRIKGFYSHTIVYLMVNLFIITVNLLENTNHIFNYSTFSAIFWGFGLLAHGISVFAPQFILGKEWEEKQIQKHLNS